VGFPSRASRGFTEPLRTYSLEQLDNFSAFLLVCVDIDGELPEGIETHDPRVTVVTLTVDGLDVDKTLAAVSEAIHNHVGVVDDYALFLYLDQCCHDDASARAKNEPAFDGEYTLYLNYRAVAVALCADARVHLFELASEYLCNNYDKYVTATSAGPPSLPLGSRFLSSACLEAAGVSKSLRAAASAAGSLAATAGKYNRGEDGSGGNHGGYFGFLAGSAHASAVEAPLALCLVEAAMCAATCVPKYAWPTWAATARRALDAVWRLARLCAWRCMAHSARPSTHRSTPLRLSKTTCPSCYAMLMYYYNVTHRHLCQAATAADLVAAGALSGNCVLYVLRRPAATHARACDDSDDQWEDSGDNSGDAEDTTAHAADGAGSYRTAAVVVDVHNGWFVLRQLGPRTPQCERQFMIRPASLAALRPDLVAAANRPIEAAEDVPRCRPCAARACKICKRLNGVPRGFFA